MTAGDRFPMSGVLILGASHAGVAVASALRSAGYDGSVMLVTKETALPYHRPPLSKEGLSKEGFAPPLLRPAAFYETNRIELRQGLPIIDLNTAEAYVQSADGLRYPYEKLVIACGAEPRRLPTALDPKGLAHYLRTHEDFARLKSRFTRARSIAIIGGGLIGAEIAAMALHRGMRATIIEAGSRLMERTVSKSIANYVLDRHQAKGLDARFGATIVALDRDENRGVETVTLKHGGTIEADLIVAAIGAVPYDALARAAGLKVDNGILVSEEGRTSDPAIYALGDCAAWYDPLVGRYIRNEAVNPSQDQAKAVAAAITGAAPLSRRMPRHWSHQAAIQIQMSGDVNDADMEAVLNSPASGAFSVLGFKDDRLVAIQTINAPQQFGKLQDMIGMDRDGLAAALDVEFPPSHRH